MSDKDIEFDVQGKTLRELHTRQNEIHYEMKSMLEDENGNDRDLSTDEEKRFDALGKEHEAYNKEVQIRNKRDERLRSIPPLQEVDERTNIVGNDVSTATADAGDSSRYSDGSYKNFRSAIIDVNKGTSIITNPETGIVIPGAGVRFANLGANQRRFIGNVLSHNPGVDPLRTKEARVLTTHENTAGGYLVADEPMADLEVTLAQYNGMMRTRAEVIDTATGADWPIPTVNNTNKYANRGGADRGEGAAAGDEDPTFGQVILSAYRYDSQIVATLEELRDASFDLEGRINGFLGEQHGRATGQDFVRGPGGANQARGLAVAANQQGTAVATSVTNGLGADGDASYERLVDLEVSINSSYITNAEFMFNQTMLGHIKKIKVTDQGLIWQPSMGLGQPATVLGYGYTVENEMQSPGTRGNIYLLFGDFSFYKIRRIQDVQIFRQNETLIRNGQIGFVAFSWWDGDYVNVGDPVRKLAVA